MYERHRHTAGGRRSATHLAWTNMIQRCTNDGRSDFGFYGGRGIRVCDNWMNSFVVFLADMGERPSKNHSLDRYPNQSGNYEPGNCRWATKDQQMQNTRSTQLIAFDGERMGLNAWARKIGITHSSLQGRLRRNWPLSKALSSGPRNEIRNRTAMIDGASVPLSQAAKLSGIKYGTVRARLARGWTTERALNKREPK